jgi:hypothetical protein
MGINIESDSEEVSRKLQEYGLPDFVFGVDKPAPLIEGNGSGVAATPDHPKLVQDEPGGSHLGDDDDGDRTCGKRIDG